MNDSLLEILSLVSIISGIIIGFFLVFDYAPVDAFFLEEEDDNSYIEGFVVKKNARSNYTSLKIYGCRAFDAYYDGKIEKNINDSITVVGSFADDFFFIDKYS